METADKNILFSAEMLELARAVLQAGIGWNWLVDQKGTVLTCNNSAKEICGGKSELPVLDGPQVQIDLAELVFSAGREAKIIELSGLELECICREKKYLAQVRVIPLELPAGWGKVFLINLTGYEYGRELSLQNVENDKLQSMTGLAAKIAHELNNPLDGSMRYINLALRRLQHDGEVLQSPEKVTAYLSSARDALGKINEILSDLIRFSRHGQSAIESVSINDMLDQAIRTLTARVQTAEVSVVTMLSENLPRAGGTRLYQVFCNLLKNAIDAVVQRRRREPECPAMITISTRMEGKCVRIIFEDTGVGLPVERNYLFDPFFTTKPAGEGTGLGLAISREIVQLYGGTILAQDGANGGARFVVELPVAGKEKLKSEN
ncbi:MAG: ATP-binding protein [Phycisphaerae bacterium]